MTDQRLALYVGLAGFILAGLIVFSRPPTTCATITGDPLGILSAPR